MGSILFSFVLVIGLGIIAALTGMVMGFRRDEDTDREMYEAGGFDTKEK
jgi:hypothetical protein